MVLERQCGEGGGGHGGEFGHLWVSDKAESRVFLLRELEPFPRIFQTVRHPVLV